MRLSRFAAVLAVAALAACSATTSRKAAVVPPPVPVESDAVMPAPEDIGGRDEIDRLLEAAQDAAALGAETDFEDCSVAVLQALGREGATRADDPSFAAYAGGVLDELDRLADQLEPVPGELEPPPEPAPVEADQLAQAQAQASAESFDLPVRVTPEVASLIGFYTGPYRERLIAALERAAGLLPFIREEMRRANLPLDLAYLPLVESAFNTRARSRARAQGLWQFMAGTGRLYGLRTDGVVDERNDPYLATKAAVAHLSDLHAAFGSWELALAAYNSGAGRVERAQRRAKGSTDFWELRRFLPRETRNYVPALWAALVVAKHPDAYGLPVFEEHAPCLERVPVSGALDTDVLAERAGLDADRLAEINPALLHRVTPVSGTYQLAVPCGNEEKVAATLASIPPDERIRRVFHVVRPGDTLSAIARRYGSTIQTVADANGIRNARALKIGQTLVIPRYPTARRGQDLSRSSVRTARTRGHDRHADPPAASASGRYVVRRGDTLYDIARRFGVTVADLQQRNALGGTRIRPGDVLLMP